MPLEPGTTLGPYSITVKIGEGGMGEVYRARDTKLDRDVALKVLPQAFTEDPDRLARFEREAKVLASLNHPGTFWLVQRAVWAKKSLVGVGCAMWFTRSTRCNTGSSDLAGKARHPRGLVTHRIRHRAHSSPPPQVPARP